MTFYNSETAFDEGHKDKKQKKNSNPKNAMRNE